VGRWDRDPDPTRRRALVLRLRWRVGGAHGPAGRGRHLRPAQRRQEAELVLGTDRPDRCRPGRGPHLHLLRQGEGRGTDQQLDGPHPDEGPDDRPLPRVHAGPHHVCHPVR